MKRLNPLDILVITLVCVFAMAILVPVCTHARGYSQQTICLVNTQGLSRAWILYYQDNDGLLIGGSTYSSTDYRWAERPLLPTAPDKIPFRADPGSYQAGPGNPLLNMEARMKGIRAGTLFTYTETEKLYHCPSDRNYITQENDYKVYRTYAITGLMNGEDFRGNGDRTVIFPDGSEKLLAMAIKSDQIIHPSEKYVFVEEDVVNAPTHSRQWYNIGGFVLMGGSLYWKWWDIPGYFHDKKSILGFADGHSEAHEWQDARTIALMTHERGERDQPPNTQPGNPDIVYMNNGYFACD